MNLIVKVSLVVVVLLAIAGCVTTTNPATGEKNVALDPNSAIVTIGEAAAEGVAAVAPFLGPTGILIGGIAAGALGAWRKIKPSLTAAKTEAEQYHAAAAATVTGLEAFKESNPEAWAAIGTKIQEQLTKQGIDPKVVENVIRGLRGLPPKA